MSTSLSKNTLLAAFVSHYDGLVDYINRHFSNRAFADDVVQDVCIQLIETPPAQDIQAPLAYFRRMSLHRAVDKSRHEKICLNFIAAQDSAHPVHHLDGASAIELKQTFDQVRDLIDRLPKQQRQVFLLHQVHGIPQHQIAIEMGISPNMVTKHFNKAVTSLNLAKQQLSL